MRSFCVIPHAVRDAPFYNGVFEDGVRLSVDGRLTPLPFSRVLSPAHQVATFVLDPLWAHMELCQNSTLLVCLPSTDPLGGTSEASSEQVDDCHGVVEDLYAQYFSSLFLHAPQSTEALVSVMSISVEDRCVYDHLQRMRVGNPSQAMRERLPASPDSHLWGTILQLATERHEALAHPEVSSAIIASQTAWVTVVELPGNGRHLVVEVGSDQSVLQTLSLILGMRGATGSPSYPPQGPLRVVLESNVAPDACVHVVAIPDGRCRPHYSLRVLRFASSCASRESTRRRGKAAQTTEGVKRSIPPSTHHETIAAMQESSSMTTPSEPPPSTSEAVPPFSCATAETLGAGVATDGESSVAPIEPILQASTPLSGQSPRRLSTHTHTSPSSPKSLPPPPQISAEEHARTSHLQRLVASLEAQLQHSTMTLVNEREKLEHWRLRAEHSQEEAKSNMLLVTTMKADVHRLEKSNQGTADQLRRQLKHVGSLEKGLMVLKAEHESLQSQLRVKTTEAARHEAANAELRRAVLRHEKRLELSKGAKETASSSAMMPSSSPAPSSHRSPENVRGPARPRIIDGKGSPDEKGIAAEEDAASSLTQRDRVAIIALEELRRRNAVLERELDLVMQENSTLRDAGLHRRSQPVGECPRCQELETHLELAVGELEEMQKEIARQSSPASAQAVVQESIPTTKGRHPGEPMPPGRVGGLNDLSSQLHVANNGITQEGWMTFDAAAAALVAGCESLMVQLQGINHTQRRILAEVHGPIISSSLLSEHLHSVRAVQEAIDDIRNRQLSRDFPRIVIATAADAAALHELLSFEATRCLHLRAFIPTFTQLAVATEHLNMRLYTSRFDEASDRATKRVYSCV